MVRLKVNMFDVNRVERGNFNSNMVRLKGDILLRVNTVLCDFNSNMVRLKATFHL